MVLSLYSLPPHVLQERNLDKSSGAKHGPGITVAPTCLPRNNLRVSNLTVRAIFTPDLFRLIINLFSTLNQKRRTRADLIQQGSLWPENNTSTYLPTSQ